MESKKTTIGITFRCNIAVADQLDELCRVYGMKRSEFFISAITSEYDKLQGNPKLKEMMEQMRQVAETMKQFTGKEYLSNSVTAIGDGASGEVEA